MNLEDAARSGEPLVTIPLGVLLLALLAVAGAAAMALLVRLG